MLAENQKTNNSTTKKTAEINFNWLAYLKILALSFLLPMWVVLVVNGSVTLWKMITWLQSDIKFWSIKSYAGMTVLLLLIPIAYFIWFYYLSIKKTLLQFHKDILLNWNREFGEFCANYLMALQDGKKDTTNQFDVAVLLKYINKKLDYLPKALKWAVRKLIDNIPLVEFVNSFEYKDLKAQDKEKLANGITKKLNEFTVDYIHSLVPKWFILLIPINILLLISYIKL